MLAPLMNSSRGTLWDDPQITVIYPEYLATLHDIVRATVPELEQALERSRELASGGDQIAEGLAGYLEHHLPEERGHAEWLLEDLEVLGIDRAEVQARWPSRAVAELKGAQAHWIAYGHPVSLLGHLWVMEGYPPEPAELEALQARTGLPPDAFRFLRRHASIDRGHAADLADLLDSLSLTPRHEQMVGLSALQTVDALGSVFADLVTAVSESPAMQGNLAREGGGVG
jgi:Iron-containing redox enzyme